MEYDNKYKIFTVPDVDIKINEYGLGCAFFEAMICNLTKLAQIDLQTGVHQTYNDLLIKSCKTALKFLELGLRPKDIISICSENDLDVIVPYIATFLIGGIVACLDPSLSQEDCSHLLSQVEPRLVFVSESCEDKIVKSVQENGLSTKVIVFGSDCIRKSEYDSFVNFNKNVDDFAPAKIDVNDTAIIFFSSGTTGLPKGICVNHSALIHQSNTYLGFANTRVNLGFATVYWISTALLIIKSILNGHCRIICKKFDAVTVWKSIEKYKITALLPSPILGINLIENKVDCDISSLEDIPFGGSSMTPENIKKLRETFPKAKVTFMYGQTEIGVFSYFNPLIPEHVELCKKYPNSVGLPAAGYKVKVVDSETEKAVGPNEVGEIRVMTKHRLNGYYKRDSSDIYDVDGYIKTGDLCYYNNDLCFYIVDRIKEMFKYQGWHITPTKLEAILLQHPAVQRAAVIGIPHPRDEHHAMGICILNNEMITSPEEIAKFVNDRVEDRWRLRAGIRIVKNFPYTPSGKLKRNELKQLILQNM